MMDINTIWLIVLTVWLLVITAPFAKIFGVVLKMMLTTRKMNKGPKGPTKKVPLKMRAEAHRFKDGKEVF